MTLQPGSRIGQYEILGLLGVGGMGEVYRARDLRLGRDVALKTLPAALVADAERLSRFEREARILATIKHANVATIHGFESDHGVTALVMELVEGETLEDRLRRASPNRGLALSSVLHLAGQIAAGLDAAHEKGIVHRDLKPANIRITADDSVKVLDFGLAKAVEQVAPAGSGASSGAAMTEVGVVLGTAAYMSPEQARGQPVDRRTDIWAFGCIVYEMLTGRAAFAGDTHSDTIAAVLRAEVDFAALGSNVPPGVRKLVTRCLERSTKARLRDIGDARLYLEDAGATSKPEPSTARGRLSRRAALAGGAALAVIGAAAGGGSALWAKRGAEPATEPTYQRLTFRRGMIRTARFAPDFQTVLYGALWDGDVCRVYSVRPDSPESTALPLPPATPLSVSKSGELALALGTHIRGVMTYGTLARVPLGGGAPRELEENIKYADWSPDGSSLAIVRRVGDHDQLEFPIGTVIAEPELPGGGFSFARVSPRGDAVAAFETNGTDTIAGRVVVVDRSGARRITSALTSPNVFGLAWKGDEVWFTAAEQLPLFRNTVHAMNASGDVRVVARAPGNASLHDVAPDGRVLIARTDDRGGIAVRVPGETSERDLSWLDEALIADISPDGRRVLFTELGVGGGPRFSIYLRGTDGSPAVRLADGFAQALSPDGRRAIVQTSFAEPRHLEVIPTGAGRSARVERPGLSLLRSRWLADGRNALVLARPVGAAARLYVLDIDGTAVRAVTPESLAVSLSGWAASPDGTMAAVSTANGVDLFPLAGGDARRVPGSSARWIVLGWIESGLLISEDPLAGGTVFRVDPATGQRDTWANVQPQDPAGIMSLNLANLVVTPDGRGYAYAWHRAISDLYVVEGWS
jgi:dipeptidyl aminopeptidase/acylaminoacyl peptidase